MTAIVHAQNRHWKPLCGLGAGAVAKQVDLVTCPTCEKKLHALISDGKVSVEMGSVHWPLLK